MTGKFRPRPVSTRYPGGVRVDIDGAGVQSWYHQGRQYAAGTVGAYLSARHPSVG